MALTVGTTTSAAVASANTTLTFSHTQDTGSDRILIVCVASLTGGAAPTSVTYAGNAMTLVVAGTDGTNSVALIYRLVNPTQGANNVVVTYGTARNFGASATSFLGGDTSSPIGTTSGATALTNNASPTRTLSTGTNGSIVIDCVLLLAASTATVGSGQTQRTNRQIVSDGYILSSTEPQPTAGSITMDWSLSGGVNWTNSAAEVKPLPLVGPANLKSLDSNVAANIKSYNGNVIANIKNISGNS